MLLQLQAYAVDECSEMVDEKESHGSVMCLDLHVPGLSPCTTEIIDRVALGEWPYLRPTICLQSHSEELGQLMQRCWAEEPTERPEFNQIKLFLCKHKSVPMKPSLLLLEPSLFLHSFSLLLILRNMKFLVV